MGPFRKGGKDLLLRARVEIGRARARTGGNFTISIFVEGGGGETVEMSKSGGKDTILASCKSDPMCTVGSPAMD